MKNRNPVISALIIGLGLPVLLLFLASQRTAAENQPGSFSCNDVTQIPQVECTALVALYKSSNGANWNNHSVWLETPTPCSWFGVTCTAGQVSSLILNRNNLVGTIPLQLGNLLQLEKLILDNNQLQGDIPGELGDLANLQDLRLNVNQLTGGIPPQLGNLAGLVNLTLGSNQLSGAIPPELGSLTHMQVLSLDNNKISGNIPPELGHVSNLLTLNLFGNQITGAIPVELGNLTHLEGLILSHNNLSGAIPPELGDLTQLNVLFLEYNQLTGTVPAALGDLIHLVELDLSGNQLTGSIPAVLGNLQNLQRLILVRNQLTGSIPAELGNLTKLQELLLYDNQLTNNIPPDLGNLVNLSRLWLFNNQLSGNIPAELGNLTNLTDLDLWDNQLSGNIPPELGDLLDLSTLNLNTNQLSGGIPAGLGGLVKLQDLDLSNNQLSGSIPSEFGDLVGLDGLSLGDNQLTGDIPPELGNLISLKELFLYSNQLSGEIPSEFENLVNLELFDLANNQLSGSIPSELGQLTNLTDLRLNNNHLSGSIPSELGNLTKLDNELDLSGNELSGNVPPELGNLEMLLELRLNDNQLSGPLPLSLANLTNIDTFWFHNTDLCEPPDPAFQAWLDGISDLQSTGVVCAIQGVDLFIESVKPVQVLEGQDLVKDKRTAVKVVIRKTGNQSVDHVSVRLTHGSSTYTRFYVVDTPNIDGQFALEYDNTFYPLNIPQAQIGRTIYFIDDRLKPTGSTFEASVTVDDVNAIAESNENNNTLSISTPVHEVKWGERHPEFRIRYFRADWWGPKQDYEVYTASVNDFVGSVYPVSEPGYTPSVSADIHYSLPFRGIQGRWDNEKLVSWMWYTLLFEKLADFKADRFVGVVPNGWFASTFPSTSPFTITVGMNIPTLGLDPLVIVEPRMTPSARLPGGASAATTAHELGHSYDLPYPQRTYGCEEEYLDCNKTISPYGIGDYASPGMWVDKRILIQTPVIRKVYSFMAAFDETVKYWVDAQDYFKLFSCAARLPTCPDHATTQTAAFDVLTKDENPPGILATGMFDITGTVSLENWYVLPEAELSPLTPGPYAFEYQDAKGDVLYEQNFDISYNLWGDTLAQAPFIYVIPYIPGTAKIVVAHNGAPLDQKLISPNAPVVNLIAPNGGELLSGPITIQWSGSDADGDPLAYAVLFSLDNGETWGTLAMDLTATSYTWDSSQLPPGTHYRVKIIATDGINTSQDISDGPFTRLDSIYLPSVYR